LIRIRQKFRGLPGVLPRAGYPSRSASVQGDRSHGVGVVSAALGAILESVVLRHGIAVQKNLGDCALSIDLREAVIVRFADEVCRVARRGRDGLVDSSGGQAACTRLLLERVRGRWKTWFGAFIGYL